MLNIKKIVLVLILLAIVLMFTGCQKEIKDEKTNSEQKQIVWYEGIVWDEGIAILDVRTPKEFNEGHIKDAILIPDYNIKELVEYVIPDKNKTIWIYCQTGIRSEKAVIELIDIGYKNVHDLGGIIDWEGEIFTQSEYSIGNAMFYSLGEVEQENIYLYGMYKDPVPGGMILYQEGQGTYFDWPGLTPRRILPELSYLDYDNDGNKELAVILYVASGTAVAVQDLHILKIDNNTDNNYKLQYTDYSLLGGDVQEWLNKEININISKDKKSLILNFNNIDYRFEYDESVTGKFTGTNMGNLVHFEFDGRNIKTKIVVGSEYENVPWTTKFFGEITATVNFDGTNFSFTDYEFSSNYE